MRQLLKIENPRAGSPALHSPPPLSSPPSGSSLLIGCPPHALSPAGPWPASHWSVLNGLSRKAGLGLARDVEWPPLEVKMCGTRVWRERRRGGEVGYFSLQEPGLGTLLPLYKWRGPLYFLPCTPILIQSVNYHKPHRCDCQSFC